ncbi:MAG: ABC transporter permease subunit, partial [Planctomycetota bacterium]
MTALIVTIKIALILTFAFLATTRAIPGLVGLARRALRLREPSPVTVKRIARFKRIKRGYYSFLAITTLFLTSLFLELIVNGRAIAASYDGKVAFPAVSEWASKPLFFLEIPYFQKKSDFGQLGESEVDWRRFKRDCTHPELLRKEVDDERAKINAERAELAAIGSTTGRKLTPVERMKAKSRQAALDRRVEELAEVDKTLAVFASGRAWCLMPVYPYGPSEFRHDLSKNPPNPPSFVDGIPLGTDEAGRDVLVLLLYGFRISLSFALVVWAAGYAIGITIGGFQGYYGGWIDIGLQRIEEIWHSIPFLYTIMIIASLTTPTFGKLVLLMVILVSWLGITAYMRAEFYREKAKDYVQAAIGCGVSDWRIMLRHILPNALVPVVKFARFAIVGYITSLVSLDFLGFGLAPGTPSWGNLLRQGLDNVNLYPHLVRA